LLACDGADSFVRKKLGIPSFDYKCEQDWIVVDYELDPKYEIKCSPYQICDYQRPATLAPIMDRHIRWEFKYNSDDNQAEMENEQNIREMMRPHAWRINKDLDISTGKLLRASKYRFHGLIAENFKLHNCFLLGDSAHQMPPFLGQGLCQGIKDVYNLHWKLTGVINGTYSKKILDTYSLERKAIVKSVTETAIKQGNIIGSQNKYIALIRDFILNCARQFPVLLNFFQFYHPWPIKDGLIDKTLFKNKANGVVIPQPDINITIEDKAFDQYIGYKFALLVFNQDQGVFDEIKSLDSVKIFDENIHLLNSNHPFNADKNFVEWQKKYNISAAIIRPDRHVYGSCDHHSIIQKIDKLSSKLHNNINKIAS
jgi:3-(3-hydroxy-phenyl)propionate hydroxylase